MAHHVIGHVPTSLYQFAYNNIKNFSISHTPFKLNYGYYSRVSCDNETDPHLRFRSTNKLTKELRELMKIYCQNLFYT